MPKAGRGGSVAGGGSGGSYTYRDGGMSREVYRGGRGLVEVGETHQPVRDGTFFRTVAVFNASPVTVEQFTQRLGAEYTRRGDTHEFTFSGNTGSAVGIGRTGIIRQALHLSGHQRHNDAWKNTSKKRIDALFNFESNRDNLDALEALVLAP